MIVKLEDLVELRLTEKGANAYNLYSYINRLGRSTMHNGDILGDSLLNIISMFGESCKESFVHDEIWLCSQNED
jgi:hypothetical protein